MMKFYRAIKFENLVILGGGVECFFLIISTISYSDFLLEIGTTLQNLIELYIIRRLLRIIQKKQFKSQTRFYH